ncbi:putative nuclease HARBI1 [Eleutherodactylus coqui]|uniref:putative nuclease HARBI1 n=1 Tax=Eleutherodactylus coqui TaxID=57060 RepID=UPI0034635928
MLTWAKRRLAAAIMIHVAEMKMEEREEEEEERPRKRQRRVWSKQLQQGESLSDSGLITELRENNPEDFRNCLHMSEESFSVLLASVKPFIEKRDTVMREAISAERRLVVTLRFLATGRSLQDLKSSAAISVPSLSAIIPETCDAIVRSLRAEYFKFPNTAEEWKNVAEEFDRRWQFPNCGGALDGKHVRISKPANSGSYYYNYEGYFSIILMALVNANYEFLMVDVGQNGRLLDGGVLENTKFMEMLQTDRLGLPSNADTKANLNFVFIGDDAFPLQTQLLTPFPQTVLDPESKIFNYRLARARRVVENTFGIMANRFHIFHTAINLRPEKIDKVVLACCVLHNFLRRRDTLSYSPPAMFDNENVDTLEVNPGEWRSEAQRMVPLQPLQDHCACDDAIRSREQYRTYFNSVGAVPWQAGII